MFNPKPTTVPICAQISIGVDYSRTIGLLAFALLFVPALLTVSYPFGDTLLYVAAGLSGTGLAAAHLVWMNQSQILLPSIYVGD